MTSVSAMKPGLGGRSNPCREIPTELEKYTSYWPDNLNFDHSGTKVLAFFIQNFILLGKLEALV